MRDSEEKIKEVLLHSVDIKSFSPIPMVKQCRRFVTHGHYILFAN